MSYNSLSAKEHCVSYKETSKCNNYEKFKNFRSPLKIYDNQIIEFVTKKFFIHETNKKSRILCRDINLPSGFIDHIWIVVDNQIAKLALQSKMLKVKGIVGKYPKPDKQYNFGINYVISVDFLN